MATVTLTEDDMYRSSTQYRMWSFTSETLAATRQATNTAAAKRVQALLGRDGATVDCLTGDEELTLLLQSLNLLTGLSDFLQLPSNVKATAVQYMKRFYLTNSCMDYYPKHMIPSALFLATKTENYYRPLKQFAEQIERKQEEVIAPEFRLTQGLRFSFHVRHAFRALEAAMMLLGDVAAGRFVSPGGANAVELQQELLKLPGADGRNVEERLSCAHDRVRNTLKTGGIVSDAYFLYTPAQIWLAALMAADVHLALFYLRCALANVSKEQEEQIISVLRDCAGMITVDVLEDKEELKRIKNKLELCSNPETSDLVKLNAAQKRNGGLNGDGHTAKKLKTTTEDPFGPPISK